MHAFFFCTLDAIRFTVARRPRNLGPMGKVALLSSWVAFGASGPSTPAVGP
jgi:hypothetical protein